MSKTMLIDAAHAEEVRVCVLENGKVEDFDFESSSRKPLRGNIYLARVTRVEPSLQAAFVEYGGNRHGFLAFNEIHPDYYQIPVSDRRLLQEAEAEEAALAAELELEHKPNESAGDDNGAHGEDADAANGEDALDTDDLDAPDFRDAEAAPDEAEDDAVVAAAEAAEDEAETREAEPAAPDESSDETDTPLPAAAFDAVPAPSLSTDAPEADATPDEDSGEEATDAADDVYDDEQGEASAEPEPSEDDRAQRRARRAELMERYREARRKRARLMRNYKIQEVIKRRQILLVQVVKEERGNKGAALTTYLSLAGRYCVLMPNTARGGGISRKIPVAADRKRLRGVVDELNVPSGIGLIIRTAGAKRTKAEIKRDYEYLIRLWENIRELTLKSIAPALIYEEASLIKRAIRDLYDKDIDRIVVQGEDGYREAKDFMKMLMPSHAKNVQPYKERTPLFLHYGVESQLDAMYQPIVRLKSGGYIVIHQTEALVAIDVNSGKSTRERNIELTALRTNLEAAREAARQCRLRDLAGLIVIDFIDMEEGKNNRAVEKRLKDALKFDRARIQVGRISNFGLLEMSRQRRRSGIVDGTTHSCPTCGGSGAVRSDETASLRILRAIETEAITGRAGVIAVKASLEVALFILNHKRDWLRRIETDYAISVEIVADPSKSGDQYEIEKRGAPRELPEATVIRAEHGAADETARKVIEEPDVEDQFDEADASDDAAPSSNDAGGAEEEERRGRRRRRRRRGRREDGSTAQPAPVAERSQNADAAPQDDAEENEPAPAHPDTAGAPDGEEGQRKRRRRGRRGGRRNRRPEDGAPGQGEPEAGEVRAVAVDGEQPDYEPLEFIDLEEGRAKGAADMPAQSPEPPPPAAAPQEDEPALSVPTPAPSEDRPRERKPTRKGWWQRAIGG